MLNVSAALDGAKQPLASDSRLAPANSHPSHVHEIHVLEPTTNYNWFGGCYHNGCLPSGRVGDVGWVVGRWGLNRLRRAPQLPAPTTWFGSRGAFPSGPALRPFSHPSTIRCRPPRQPPYKPPPHVSKYIGHIPTQQQLHNDPQNNNNVIPPSPRAPRHPAGRRCPARGGAPRPAPAPPHFPPVRVAGLCRRGPRLAGVEGCCCGEGG